MKPTAQPGSFDDLDIRIGRVVSAQEARTRKPTYRMVIDFGAELGTKVSCGAYRNYAADDLVGRLVVAVVNLGTKQMGPEMSEVLVLGVTKPDGGTTALEPESEVSLGSAVS